MIEIAVGWFETFLLKECWGDSLCASCIHHKFAILPAHKYFPACVMCTLFKSYIEIFLFQKDQSKTNQTRAKQAFISNDRYR